MAHRTFPLRSQGPFIDVVVGMSHRDARRRETAGRNQPAPIHLTAMIDTGASRTFIDRSVVQALGLVAASTAFMSTPASGSSATEIYDISLVLPGPNGAEDGLVLPDLRIATCELYEAQAFHALIGRDVLAHCILIYNGSAGTVTLAF